MMTDMLFDFLSEPERYELHEGPLAEVSRRDFFRIAGAGVVVALLTRDTSLAQRPMRSPASQELGAWLHVGADSAVTVYSG